MLKSQLIEKEIQEKNANNITRQIALNIPLMEILADHLEVPSRTLCLTLFMCWTWIILVMLKIFRISSKISGLFLSRIFILSFMAMMMCCVRSSAPVLELFSAAPEETRKGERNPKKKGGPYISYDKANKSYTLNLATNTFQVFHDAVCSNPHIIFLPLNNQKEMFTLQNAFAKDSFLLDLPRRQLNTFKLLLKKLR